MYRKIHSALAIGVASTSAGALMVAGSPSAQASPSAASAAQEHAAAPKASPQSSRAAVAWPDISVTWHWGGPNIIGRYSESESKQFVETWSGSPSKMRADVRKAFCGAAENFKDACEVAFDNTVPDFSKAVNTVKKTSKNCIAVKVEVSTARFSSWAFKC